jgi:CheY-like chemotaxis protein
LFEAFVQTESGRRSGEGTGLGLAISRSFVKLMGGELWVRSQEGRGTVFGFEVELEAREGVEQERGAGRVTGVEWGERRPRVLVVDDKWENRMPLMRMLGEVGFEVAEASDGAEAVEMWERWRPDLIWMDIRMPGMDGYEATRRIRRAEAVASGPWPVPESQESRVKSQKLEGRGQPRSEGDSPGETHPSTAGQPLATGSPATPARPLATKIIALTGSVFEEDRPAIFEAGCDDFVVKPYRTATILEKLSQHLGVRYLYEEAAPVARTVPELTPADLAPLPRPVTQQLQQALVHGDRDEALRIVDAIHDSNEAVAQTLRSLVERYRFDEILHLVEKI